MSKGTKRSLKSLGGAAGAASLALLLASPAMAADRVAQVSKADGKVTIARAADNKVDEATQAGPRVRNGSVFAGDVVATDAGGTATLVFSDGTEIQLKEKTKLTVREVDFTALVKSGKEDKPIGRRIQVLSGSIWTHVVPNSQVATAFETPSGVAAVKGTTLSISVDGAETSKP